MMTKETLLSIRLLFTAFLRATRYSWEDIRGRNCSFLQGPATEPSAVKVLQEALATQADARVNITNYTKDGQPFRNLLAIRPVVEYKSELDAGIKRDGTFRYVIGVQYAFTAGTGVGKAVLAARLSHLETLIELLPTEIVRSHYNAYRE